MRYLLIILLANLCVKAADQVELARPIVEMHASALIQISNATLDINRLSASPTGAVLVWARGSSSSTNIILGLMSNSLTVTNTTNLMATFIPLTTNFASRLSPFRSEAVYDSITHCDVKFNVLKPTNNNSLAGGTITFIINTNKYRKDFSLPSRGGFGSGSQTVLSTNRNDVSKP